LRHFQHHCRLSHRAAELGIARQGVIAGLHKES
jgi:hypothetical protein